ncbi:MAG TPA: FtsK/SpoIIIE domain-containing protein [Pirellulales bacterium]
MSVNSAAQREMLAQLHRLSAQREMAERQMRSEFETATARAQTQRSDSRQAAIMRFQMDRDSTQREYDAAVAGAKMEYDTRHEMDESNRQQATARAQADFSSTQRRAKRKLTEENWEANTVFEATQNAPKLQREQQKKEIRSTLEVLSQALELANQYLVVSRLKKLLATPPATESAIATESTTDAAMSADASLSETASTEKKPVESLTELAKATIAHLTSIKQQRWPKLLAGGSPAGLVAVVCAIICGASYLIFSGQHWTWLVVGGVLALALSVAGGIWLYKKAVSSVAASYDFLVGAPVQGDRFARAAMEDANRKCAAESQRIVEHRDRELEAARQHFDTRSAEATSKRDTTLQEIKQQHELALAELTQTRETALAEAHRVFPVRLEEIQKRYQTDLAAAQENFEAASLAAGHRRDQSWNSLSEQWREVSGKIRASIDESQRQSQLHFPAWNSPQWNHWEPPTAAPPLLEFGKIHIDLKTIPGAISSDARFNGLIPTQFDLPALFPFPQNASLILKAAGEGRQQAISAVQAIMLRMLTSVPPSKVRFTIIDPVGLGENFAGFMHLADHDEQLVTNRIWTEPTHIEQRLADLTEQMENVIQKYLRNEFRSIDEYNAFAGEVAEPFRVLVVANFPVNFTETAARRLTSIATSGARCGVYVLLVNDTKLPLPANFDMKDLERSALTLTWNGGQFVYQDPDYEKYPLRLEQPPPEEQFTALVQAVGRGAKTAKRVEVPFEYVAPQPSAWWTGDTAKSVRVPLGRAGATKLQYLNLGEGTAQHVLIAGKTGSGKSTLLHAMVTNLALTYSPEQVEMYLIDFKKGVEFKTYATHQLPHARVIAIESEREFGYSVLEKLDGELKRRGDLFREAGVQDLAGYRAGQSQQVMPRILLMVDEFQELFTDDDKLAQDSALLLDRLVRQGRAFGMHVLLGSQTLGGAYSLARSTIGQMAVRIALQCSEADAHLILSEENSAARLLSRPGEAIYNDANGLVHGNHPFQIVWLSEERREQYLQSLQELSAERVAAKTLAPPPPPIVFEGNVPAAVRRNRGLVELLRSTDWPVQSTPVHAWLGEAIAIKDPTAAILRPQSGDNLLIVGQRPESAMGMLAAAMVSLAAQHRPTAAGSAAPSGFAAGSSAQFYVLEHDRPVDLPIDKPLADFRGGLAAFATVLPHAVHSAGRRELPTMLAEIAREVDRRLQADDHRAPATYLFISDLGRFRDLRRDESDMGFSFSAGEKPPSPSQMLSTILREGPAVGVYTLAWCDSLTAVNRAFDRQTLREFALRVLLQMSANDSSHLIDTPLASKLGPHVAIFYNEEEGRLEKFRPYAWPSLEWLIAVQERFNLRVPAENV